MLFNKHRLFTDIDIYQPSMYHTREFSNRLLRVVIKKAVTLKRALIEMKNNTQFGIDSYIYNMKISYWEINQLMY